MRLRVLLRDEDFDQSGVAAGGGGMKRRPQLVVLSVDVGSSVQQDLYHLLVIVNTALGREGKKKIYRNTFVTLSFFWLNILQSVRGKMKKAERENDIDSESGEAEKIGPHFSASLSAFSDVATEQKMKCGPRGSLVTLP